MLIREWQEGDLDGLVALYRQFQGAQSTAAPDELRARWAATRVNPAIRGILAEAHGGIVSTCTLLMVPNLAGPSPGLAYIEHVITASEHRRLGFGRAVLKAALDLAWRQGCYKVMLMTDSRNEGTLQFYEDAGFVRGGSTAFVARPPAVA